MRRRESAIGSAVSPPKMLESSSWLAIITGAVIVSQASFLMTAYLHAFATGALAYDSFHISAVLDNDERSAMCACVGIGGLVSLVLLERCRAQPRPILRTALAAACGVGIILTCVVRESQYTNCHRGTAVLAFGAAVALVWVVSSLSRDVRSLRSAGFLVILVVLTGSAQFANILSREQFDFVVLPSWALGTLELCLCACFRATSRLRPPVRHANHLPSLPCTQGDRIYILHLHVRPSIRLAYERIGLV